MSSDPNFLGTKTAMLYYMNQFCQIHPSNRTKRENQARSVKSIILMKLTVFILPPHYLTTTYWTTTPPRAEAVLKSHQFQKNMKILSFETAIVQSSFKRNIKSIIHEYWKRSNALSDFQLGNRTGNSVEQAFLVLKVDVLVKINHKMPTTAYLRVIRTAYNSIWQCP